MTTCEWKGLLKYKVIDDPIVLWVLPYNDDVLIIRVCVGRAF